MLVLAISPIFLALLFPEVEDPWPEKIGLWFLFQAAGAGGFVMEIVYAKAPEARRDRAIRWGGLLGFRIGAGFYALSLLAQLSSWI
jgi:hypothetical protein